MKKTPQAFEVVVVLLPRAKTVHPPSCPTSSEAHSLNKEVCWEGSRPSLVVRKAIWGHCHGFPHPHPAACSQPSPGPTFLDCGVLQGSGKGSLPCFGGPEFARKLSKVNLAKRSVLLCPSPLHHLEALPVLSWGPTSLSFDWGISPFLLREQLVTPCLRNWWRSQLDLVEKKASHF